MKKLWMLCSLVCLLSFSFVACTQPEGKTDSPTENVVKEGTSKDGSTEVVAEKPGEKPGEPAKELVKEPVKEPVVDSDAAAPQEKDPSEPGKEPVVPEKPADNGNPDNGNPDTTNPDNGSGDELKPPAGDATVQGNWFMGQMALGFCESLHKRCCGQKKLSPQVSAVYGTDLTQCKARLLMFFKSNGVSDWSRAAFFNQQPSNLDL